MPLSYPYKQNEEDKEIPELIFLDETLTPFAQYPPEDTDAPKCDDNPTKSTESNGN